MGWSLFITVGSVAVIVFLTGGAERAGGGRGVGRAKGLSEM